MRRKRPTPISGPSLPADPATVYARRVVDGNIVAGELVRHACERHLRDLIEGPARGLTWRPDKAAHALNFYPSCLTVTAGMRAGQPFHLLPWMEFCIGSQFGWYRESGLLRFRVSWWETGKGQAKSPLMGATAVYMIGFRGIARAEGYAIAWEKDQAGVVFRDAVAMCREPMPDDSESLESRGDVIIRGVGDNAWKIEHVATGSKFQVEANTESISGPRPSIVVADEVHEFKTAKPITMWKAAIDKVPGDSLMLLGTNTPATDQFVGTEYSDYFAKVAMGSIDAKQSDGAFGYIARVDENDDPFKDESCWPKALPALGITFEIEKVRERVNQARDVASEFLSTQRLYFGIRAGATKFWINYRKWRACRGKIDLQAMKPLKCWLSLDLSQKNDLTAVTAVWIGEDGHLYAKTWYWTTAEGLPDRIRAEHFPYDQAIKNGFITAVPGSVIDLEYVADEVKRIYAEFKVEYLAFDPAMISDFLKACQQVGLAVWVWEGPDKPAGIGLKLVSHAQGTRVKFDITKEGERVIVEDKQLCMPRSYHRLTDAILNQRLTYEENPVTEMCSANTEIFTDRQKNCCFDKQKSRGRIDGIVTLAMAVGAVGSANEQKRESVYEALARQRALSA